jgi:hypothetical protein
MSESNESPPPPEEAAARPRRGRRARAKAFLSGLVSTRLDKSGGRIRQLALVLALAYAGAADAEGGG